jgi:hypothetical protein
MKTALLLFLFANIAAYILYISIRFRSRRYLQVIAAGWVSMVVALLYVMVDSLGGSNPKFALLGQSLPWYSILPIALSVVALTNIKAKLSSIRSLVVLALCGAATLLGEEVYIVELANQTADDVHLLLFTGAVLLPFGTAMFAPAALFWSADESIGGRLFRVSQQHIREHWLTLLKGLGWFVLAYGATNIWVEGNLVNFYFIQDPGTLVRYAAFTGFYLVLMRHFVFIAVVKYVVDTFFSGERTSMGEVLLFGCIFALVHYYLPLGLVVREFLFGLIFGYWYLKTRSLTYGIVLRWLSFVVT